MEECSSVLSDSDETSRCNWRRRRRNAAWWLLLMLLGAVPLASGQLRPNTDISTDRTEGVCQSVDVRNTVEAFKRLSGCRVVEGFVQIVLIDHAVEDSFDNLSFPELREVTHYLLLYRVNGLRSLGKLFPNLAVIRGETLFLNYALVVFEMIHLQELGLYSLTDILRGGVRIEKNPLLCFVDTVDWDLIVKAGHSSSISGNRVQNECPMCPSDQLQCRNSSKLGSLCWNRRRCQKVCPDKCGNGSCTSDGQCCHELCLGGCSGPGPEDCLVCRDVVFQKMCIKLCPAETYKYLNRRCITADECRNMSRPRERSYELRPKPYKPFRGLCSLDCPPGFVETEDGPRKYSCTHCKGPCRKECQGVNVESIAAAQRMRGCTYIKGPLEIQIRGGKNVVKELEENLNMIEEIEGYLKIVRSFPLVSLNFLRNLRVIHGSKLDSGKYAFVLLDNQNLQELWDWTTRKEDLRILNGRLFFHFNPKLCLYKIEKLKQVARLSDFTDLEVAANSNGDKVACNVTELHTHVTKLTEYGALIEWEQFEHYDPRTLLGYVVYHIEAPYKNVTVYDGRDACGGDGWHVEDMPVTTNITIITHLTPYTQYAYFVKTYTIATERTGAQSKIKYFRTLPSSPSPPVGLEVTTTMSNSLTIKWQPPQTPNGNVTHYVIMGTWIKDNHSMLDQRNYCNEPLIPDKKPTPPVQEEDTDSKEAGKCLCKDDPSNVETTLKEKERAAQIHFEDSLHNLLYIKRPSQSRRKRDTASFWQDTTLGVRNMVSPRLVEPSEFGDPDYQTTPQRYPETTEDNMEMTSEEPVLPPQPKHNFRYIVYGKTQIVVQNLSHYMQYTISVEACREIVTEEPSNTTKNCSRKSVKTGRTLSLVGADNVDSNKLVIESMNESLGQVKLKWEEPPSPNGIIVTYQIEYKSIEHPNYSPMVECITRNQFLNNGSSYNIQNLQPGNYSLRVRAMSLAGYGEYTRPKYFCIKAASSSSLEFLIGALMGTAVVAALLCIVVVYLRRRYIPGIPNVKLIATVNPEYVTTVYEPDEWEVPRKMVDLLRELGQGSFGMVYDGIVHDVVEGQPEMRCAIKTVNEHATDRERSEFLNEASVMKAFHTHHVVRLLGVVSQGQPVLVVMELMANGDLKTYLRSHRPDVCEDASKQPPTLKRILQMAVEIADGMAYLAGKKFVHRDLAARNCMVAEDLTVKIGDFGMTRDIYETDYYRKGTKGLLPVRWMAPESLKDGVFTSHSDVWSYGVVLWEMATLASQPYQGLSNDQVLRYVIDGGVMERPENCPDRLYQLMRLCWQHKPMTRPPFLELVSLLLPDVSQDFAKVSFYHSEEGRELYAPTRAELTDDPSTPLRVTRDVEDFSLGDGSEDDEGLETDVEVGFPHHYHSMSIPRNRDILVSTPPNGKVGNGSAATSPTAVNGWVVGPQSNGTSGTNSTGSAGMKTTQC